MHCLHKHLKFRTRGVQILSSYESLVNIVSCRHRRAACRPAARRRAARRRRCAASRRRRAARHCAAP